ncbi:Nitrite reductase [NAD(P)H] small subunit [Brachybacterium faecium]|nr:Nitrite reductase [NAD(P)H] small subunit [Brachybacterium faecium]
MTIPADAFVPICAASALTPERGTAALLPDGTQIAMFLLDDGSVRAVQQHDPYSGANVLSRGLVGTHLRAGEGEEPGRLVPTLSSPMYKQSWDLDTGEVLDAGGGEPLSIAVHDVVVRSGQVRVAPRPRPAPGGDA